jgi:Domain of unknown function (DUF1905)
MLPDEVPSLELEFSGEVVHWRGPSPFHFVAIPDDESRDIEAISSLVTYGWGVIPVRAQLGAAVWTTSLFPRNGRYLLPVRDAIRAAEDVEVGQTVRVRLVIELERPARSVG